MRELIICIDWLSQQANYYGNNAHNDVSPVHTNRSEDDIENTKVTICLANILPFVEPGAGDKDDAGDYVNRSIQRRDMHDRAKF
jgi:hypothetical protein